MKKPKMNGEDRGVVLLVDGDEVELMNVPAVVVLVLRRLHAENEEMRRRLDEIQGPPEPKQKRAYRKRDNGADVAVVAVEGSP